MDIKQKSIGFLIDQLITTNIRCWFAQEKLMDKDLSDGVRLASAEIAQRQNSIRSRLIKAIDEVLKQDDISLGVDKTYDK
jgi:hypothetical protein